MLGLRVIWVGKSQPRFVEEGVSFYRERIAHFQPLELVEVRAASHSGRDTEQALRRESDAIFKRLSPEDTVVLLDERGRQRSTPELADWLAELQAHTGRPLTLVVGGAYGVDDAVRRRADHALSLSALTWPHQLVRVMLLEQLYRCCSLRAGHAYHHA